MSASNQYLSQILEDLERNLPGWEIIKDVSPIAIQGVLKIGDGNPLNDDYFLKIQLSAKHPTEPPIVFEVGNTIPHVPERHFNDDGSACLFLPEETPFYWNEKRALSDFLEGPVRSFFIGQSYFSLTGEWIFGERKHGILGVLEFYCEFFQIENPKLLEDFFRTALKDSIKGHHPCPCNSGHRVRNCHRDKIFELQSVVPKARLQYLLSEFVKARSSK